jgi:hypothetical protein
VPGAGLTFSTPVTVSDEVAEDEFVGWLADGELLLPPLHPVNEIAVTTQAQAISHFLNIISLSLSFVTEAVNFCINCGAQGITLLERDELRRVIYPCFHHHA